MENADLFLSSGPETSERVVCRGAWARVTIDHCRRSALQTFKSSKMHTASSDIFVLGKVSAELDEVARARGSQLRPTRHFLADARPLVSNTSGRVLENISSSWVKKVPTAVRDPVLETLSNTLPPTAGRDKQLYPATV